MNKKIEIGLRLKEFAKNNFGGIAGLERILQKRPAYFQKYISGRSFNGGDTLAKLANLGCDINWLLNGTPSAEIVKEPPAEYIARPEFDKLKEGLRDLKVELYDMKKERVKLMDYIEELEIEKAKLSVEVAALAQGLSKSSMK